MNNNITRCSSCYNCKRALGTHAQCKLDDVLRPTEMASGCINYDNRANHIPKYSVLDMLAVKKNIIEEIMSLIQKQSTITEDSEGRTCYTISQSELESIKEEINA